MREGLSERRRRRRQAIREAGAAGWGDLTPSITIVNHPSRPDSDPPRSLRQRLERSGPLGKVIAVLATLAGTIAGALEVLRLLDAAIR